MKQTLPLFLLLVSYFIFNAVTAQKCSVSIAPQTCTNSTLQAITDNDKKVDTLKWYNGGMPVQVSIHKNLSTTVDTITAQNVFALIGYDDVVLDDSGNVYATAGGCNIYEWKKSTGTWIVPAGNVNCTGSATLYAPTGIAVDSLGAIYIAEAAAHRVTKWVNGVRTVIAKNLNVPFKLSLDKENSLYILDQGDEAVYKLPSGATKYTLVAGGNGTGSALNQFNVPTCMDVDDDMNIYIGDPKNNRVVKWAPGALQGTVVAGGGSNAGTIYDSHPTDLQVDAKKNLFIEDGRNLIYWPAGSDFGITVGKLHPDDYDPSLAYPIFIDKQYNVYEGSSGYLVQFSPTSILNTTHFEPREVAASYTVEGKYTNGCIAVSDTTRLVQEPYYPNINGQYGGTCGLTLTYSNYYADDPTNPTIQWTAPAGTRIFSGQGTNTIQLHFTDSFTTGSLAVQATNACSSYTDDYDLSAAPAPGSVNGYKKVSANQKSVRYYIYPYEYNSVYTWTVPAGATITKGQGTDTILVAFGSTSGKISAVTSNACGTSTNYNLKVTVNSGFADGKEAASVTALENENDKVKLFPQPADNYATLQMYASKNEVYTIRITDLSGKVVYTNQRMVSIGVNNLSLDIHALASGTYVVSICNKTERAKSIKLIKSSR